MSRFSNYIVYLDELGDRNLNNVDPNSPLFIRNFCIFDKRHYGEVVVPKIQALKFRHFGHDGVFFDVDGARGPNQHQQFIQEINELIEHCNFVLISCLVDKTKVKDADDDVFDKTLAFGLDHTYRFLQERNQSEHLTYVVGCGQDEIADQQLQQRFRQCCEQQNHTTLPFELHLTRDNHRPLGLQFAHLLAAPILNHHNKPDEDNPPFDSLKTKFYCKGGRKTVGKGYEGWGLKLFN